MSSSLPPGWSEAQSRSKQGRTYFVNRARGTAAWTLEKAWEMEHAFRSTAAPTQDDEDPTFEEDDSKDEDPTADTVQLSIERARAIMGIGKERLEKDMLRRAFKKRVLTVHPDKGGSSELFLELQAAYEFLLTVSLH